MPVEELEIMRHSIELAETPGLGRVYDCGGCNCIHVQVGPVSLTLTRSAYCQLVEMLNRSASNFELALGQMHNMSPAGEVECPPFGAISPD